MHPADYVISAPLSVDKTLLYLYFMDKSHPLSDKKGRVWYHRHVASVKLGRWLTSFEVAHHKDEDRTNNHPDNLEVKTRSEHTRDHTLDRSKQFPSSIRSVLPLRQCAHGATVFSGNRYYEAKYCSYTCASAARQVFDVSASKLKELITLYSFTKIGKIFGVSDNTIRKRCRKLGLI